jgi:hypothetical protein
VLYVNPIIRYDGKNLSKPAATVDLASTWALRGGGTLGAGFVWLAYARRRRRAQQPVTRPVLADVKRHIA